MRKFFCVLTLIFIIPYNCFSSEGANMSFASSKCKGIRVNVINQRPEDNYEYIMDFNCSCGKKSDLYNEDNDKIGITCLDEKGVETYISLFNNREIMQIRKIAENTYAKYDVSRTRSTIYKIINNNLTEVYGVKDQLIGKIETKGNKKFYYDIKGNLLASGDKNKKIQVTFCEFGGTSKALYNDKGKRAFTICDDGKRQTVYGAPGELMFISVPVYNNKNTKDIVDPYKKIVAHYTIEKDGFGVCYDLNKQVQLSIKTNGSNITIFDKDKKAMGVLHYKK